VVGPIVASLFMRFFGVGGLFAYSSTIHFCIILYAVHRLRSRAVTPVEEHIAFAEAMRMAGMVSSVDSQTHTGAVEKTE
jgi:hypothetical protein